jgi:histidinol-phosphatase (PHP family)
VVPDTGLATRPARSGVAPALVSVHGGHSGQFCSHARDPLEALVEAYAEQGFAWVGITEHAPAVSDELVPPEERRAGLDARGMEERFAEYVATCRTLQRRFARRLRLYVAFEAETCTGWQSHVARLVREHAPDYVVGSVHHVQDVPIDATPEQYTEVARQLGGVDALYAAYFDAQLEMLEVLRPRVVGHFDLIRLLDPDARRRLHQPAIRARVTRNLRAVRDRGALLDYNVRALAKGLAEPYPTDATLREAHALGLAAVPGDDSHGVAEVGRHVAEGARRLETLGFDTRWPRPA